MRQQLRVITIATALLIILPAAKLAVADEQAAPLPKGNIVQPVVIQQTPISTVGPASRTGKLGALGVQDSVSVLLTVKECEGLGGKVNDVSTKTCQSGQACITAGSDGVIRSKCIDNKAN